MLRRIVEPVLQPLEAGDPVPGWAGIDILRGTLFYLQRMTHHWEDVPPEQERQMRLLVAVIGQISLGGPLDADDGAQPAGG
jgi:hypothetical protein